MTPDCPTRGCWPGSLEKVTSHQIADGEETLYFCNGCGKCCIAKNGIVIHQQVGK